MLIKLFMDLKKESLENKDLVRIGRRVLNAPAFEKELRSSWRYASSMGRHLYLGCFGGIVSDTAQDLSLVLSSGRGMTCIEPCIKSYIEAWFLIRWFRWPGPFPALTALSATSLTYRLQECEHKIRPGKMGKGMRSCPQWTTRISEGGRDEWRKEGKVSNNFCACWNNVLIEAPRSAGYRRLHCPYSTTNG